MADLSLTDPDKFDRTNAVAAGAVFLVSFITYALTVQPTFSFWDCGEFIATSYILGIPHPPGTPLFILLGRIFSVIPFVEDISHRINYISVITSAFTAMFSYLLTVRLVQYFFGEQRRELLNRVISYVGGVVGGLFVAFSRTNWGNSVEAEVYGAALALSVMIIWLAVQYHDARGTSKGIRLLILIFYLAMLGIGLHMTVFLVVPVAAFFLLFNRDAVPRDYAYLAAFVGLELLLIVLFSGDRGGPVAFYLTTVLLAALLVVLLYRKINWAILIALAAVSTVMISFSLFMEALPFFVVLMIGLAVAAHRRGWRFQWLTGLGLIVVAVLGISVHAFIPIRSAHNPRIDENNPSRNWSTFVKFLDRKQYGSESMVDRMFHRRGTWENQFGHHPHMGFFSYFEEQYSPKDWGFVPFLGLGLLGVIVAVRKRQEIGLPYLVLLVVTSAGLILYMNFADGTQYDPRTGDAYLEVRDRDYFFTPAFVFFGIAIGMGVSALMMLVREALARRNPAIERTAVYAMTALVLLPAVPLAHNYHANDRSDNYLPYNYAANLLDSVDKNAILFTSGDNDTFPLWAIQEVYNYRKDVRVVNLSLLNTDWYVYQMKHFYNVPISLEDDQILWEDVEVRPGLTLPMPVKEFRDRPRNRTTWLAAVEPYNGQMVKVQDMMVDEIVVENRWKDPIFFSSQPYDSPLDLQKRTAAVGVVYRLDRTPPERLIDAGRGYDLFMHTYRFQGYEDSKVYRDENATGVFIGYGINAVRLWDEFEKRGQLDSAMAIADKIMKEYPEYAQMYMIVSNELRQQGDTAAADSLLRQAHDTLTAFCRSNPENLFYLSDLGLIKVSIGSISGRQDLLDDGLALMWEAFRANPESGTAFRKLFYALSDQRRYAEIQEAARLHASYPRNLEDPFLQQLLGLTQSTPRIPPGAGQ
ncbi:MAG TPA: DUF2723 domain-containing protein [candidate division Zixibacteria bacterium]|nr:DUF2723 domain-containing protein [candidate division Zixibacteria bacterium]MDD4916613.1 DUF2723 domain-containing protein [candidate division Zixibacteria bacterium]MDM7974126.1 DUF2723 domain-containing protein [candidate division Zixibacteria bacterium]HOD65504.1 DUF2723 domain-containing protein [candidate division Zixibacteria bacterium]HPM37853.1 DUF2723 domain-containing protein [candidate division Zixibacteria bacterium]